MDAELPSQEPERQKIAGNPADQCDKTSNEAQQAEIPITRPPSDVPPSPTSPQNSGSERQGPHKSKPNWVEVTTLILEFLGIAGLAYYCWINNRELKVFDSERITIEKSQTQDERAWVLTTGNLNQEASANNDRIIIDVSFKNTGKTPALNLEDVMYWTTNQNRIPKKDGYPSVPEHEGLCAPDEVIQLPTEPIPVQIMAAVADGTSVYIFGTIWYDDIFLGHHWSQFCYAVRRSPINKTLIQYEPLQIHNSCDDAETNQTK